MANDKKFLVKNGLTTQNISFVDDTQSANNTIVASMLSTDTLSFSGNSGQLFSITDSLSGTIFAVNDISGVPSIEVDDDGTIRLAETFGYVLVGTDTAIDGNKLQVAGNVTANGEFYAQNTQRVFHDNYHPNADALTTARTISLGGVLSGSASFDGSANITITAAHTSDPVITLTGDVTGTGTMTNLGNVSIATTVATNSVALGTDTTGNYVATGAVSGNGLSGSASAEGATFTVTSNATNVNTGSTIVFRDASGNFSAGTITAALSGNATTATTLQTARTIGGVSFNGSANINLPGVNTAGNQNTSGNAATASNASLLNNISAVNLYNNMGGVHGNLTSFDATTPSYDFGYRFVQGSTNGPGTGGSQFYSWYIGIGSNFPATGTGSYGAMFAVDRNSSTPYLSVRYNEANSFDAWRRISAGKADTLTTARTIGGVSFNGSANINLPGVNTAGNQNTSGNAATATTLQTARTIAISGDITGTATSFNGGANISISSAITAGAIVNADINASAGIVDTKLATISTAGKVSNSATTATNANTASAIVARDASGNFSAGTITAALSGNASTATTLQTGRTINGTSFNGSANITTANWGTARNISLGGTSKSVNGSTNYTWTITELGITKTNIDALNINADTVDGIQAASFLRSDADDTATGTIFFNDVYNRFNTGNTNNTTTADTNGLYLHTSGYLDGRYTTRFRKRDENGGVPLYIDNSAAVANIFTPVARFGSYTGNIYEFEVFGDASITGALAVGSNLTVTGNLTVNGTTTTINTETINLADNIIVLNSNEAGTPSQNAGIEVERGTSTNVVLQWNETSDHWEIASGGTTGRILTTGDEGSGNGIDADTVDGIQASALVQTSGNQTISGIKTFSSELTSNNDGNGITLSGGGRFYKKVGDGLYIRKPSGGQELKFEDNAGNLIGTFWHSGNDGAASGLDADTVDGIQAASFLRSDANDDFSGTLNYTPDTGTVLAFDGQAVLRRLNADGALAIGHDSALIMGGGEAIDAMVTNLVAATEAVYIGAENGVTFYSFPDNNTTWSNRKEMVYDVNGNLTVPGQLNAITKSFVIDHPTKPDMKLRYGSLEGPENGVYVRGRLTGSNTIELPDYWTGLVHEDSITVNLTPIGRKHVWVESIDTNTVSVGCDDAVDCFYTIFAERKDVNKLEVEYDS